MTTQEFSSSQHNRNGLQGLSGLHNFSKIHGVYPVALSTLLCVGLFALRAYLSRSWTFRFLLWNLFLAWVPYLGSLWASYIQQRNPKQWWRLLFPLALSVVFLPNAPYIITDFFHLTERFPIPLWYDIGFLASFAWTGIILAIYTLSLMQAIIKTRLGTLLSWGFVVINIALSGLGIYLGRFLRWNSWDLVTQPQAVLNDVAQHISQPWAYPRTIGVSLLFAALVFASYLAFVAGPTPARLQKRR